MEIGLVFILKIAINLNLKEVRRKLKKSDGTTQIWKSLRAILSI